MKKWLYIYAGFLFMPSANAQLTYENLLVDYDSAWQYKNLKIIPIKAKGPGNPGNLLYTEVISLQQGLRNGFITLSERGSASTENVHWLRLNNKTNKPVFVASGEILAGGRQDRMVTKDTLMIPTGNDQYIPVMCAEEGRWSEKEKKFVHASYANPRLRKVLDQSKNQLRIWREIANQLDSNKIKSPTLAYAAPNTDKKFALQKDEYFKFFEDKFKIADSTILGIICISGDKVIGCDAFAGVHLFYNSLEPLLEGYINEAIYFGRTPIASDTLVKKYMDQFMIDEYSQEQYLKKNGKLYKYDGKVIHLTAY